MPWNPSIPRSLACGLALAALAPSALAQTAQYADATFDPLEWSLSSATFGNGGVVSASQNGVDGVPAPSREVEQTVNAAPPAGESVIAGLHVHTPASYPPTVLGAIESLDFSVDYANLASCVSGGTGQRFGLGIEQAGEYFADPDFFTGSFPGFFLPHLQETLEADDFGLVDLSLPGRVDPNVHPDFGASGPTLRFGLYTENSTTGGSLTRCVAWDNWNVTLRHTPAANALAGCADLLTEDFESYALGSDLCTQPGWTCAPGEDDPLRIELGALGSRLADGHATPGGATRSTTARTHVSRIGQLGRTVFGFTARAFSAASVQSRDAPIGLRDASGAFSVSWTPAERYPGSGSLEDQWLFCVTGLPCTAVLGGFDQPVAARIVVDPAARRVHGELDLATGTVDTAPLPITIQQIDSLVEVFIAVTSSDTSQSRGAEVDQLVMVTTDCSVPTLPGSSGIVYGALLLAAGIGVLAFSAQRPRGCVRQHPCTRD